MSGWGTKDIPRLDGTTAVVTGANSGIGYYTALELARAGAEVVIGCRDAARGEEALSGLRQQSGGKVELVPLDLSSLASVRSFAEQVRRAHPRLDLLVNNAGIMALPRRETTVDGFEKQFGTNHLGHFALTGLLLPALRASAAPRVVTVSSGVAWGARLDIDDLQSERRYTPMGTYGRSKLANLMFMLELQRRAGDTGLRSMAAHPGGASTGLQKHAFTRSIKLLGQSAQDGALPSLRAATAADVRGGEYYGPRILLMRGAPIRAWVPPQARNEQLAARLWQRSEELTGVRFDLPPGTGPRG
ncbi:oxidoreductase [Nannocystis bainbridge]|uniref:Oxidoreductase n=1 Tax=Nannocystis bainbridge TaxID=2995303 RepID=A0ABT5E9J1_9BACT|nr:oxidoreductase [Nannocystis bainbridge]MDC0722526.1 oxidoreductase [Nannocystis bainbridge]